jgi:two-component system OmpR family response regulator
METNWTKTVLIVEDEVDTREMVSAVLRAAGYATAEATDGQQALALLEEHGRPSLIIVDQCMPVMRGSEFLRRLGSRGAQPPIPVVVVSADPKSDSLPPGFAAFLRKPFDAEDLLAVLALHCRRAVG